MLLRLRTLGRRVMFSKVRRLAVRLLGVVVALLLAWACVIGLIAIGKGVAERVESGNDHAAVEARRFVAECHAESQAALNHTGQGRVSPERCPEPYRRNIAKYYDEWNKYTTAQQHAEARQHAESERHQSEAKYAVEKCKAERIEGKRTQVSLVECEHEHGYEGP
jgi:hypothetical protein